MNNNELMHHGVLGMKWGIRRYQNPDGTLTAAGKKKYGKLGESYTKMKTAKKKYNKAFNKAAGYSSRHPISQYFGKRKQESDKRWAKAISAGKKYTKTNDAFKKIAGNTIKKEQAKIAMGGIVVSGILGTALGTALVLK